MNHQTYATGLPYELDEYNFEEMPERLRKYYNKEQVTLYRLNVYDCNNRLEPRFASDLIHTLQKENEELKNKLRGVK